MSWQTTRAIERKYEALPKPKPSWSQFLKEQTKLYEDRRKAKVAKMFERMRGSKRQG
jgi:hypothetical protein